MEQNHKDWVIRAIPHPDLYDASATMLTAEGATTRQIRHNVRAFQLYAEVTVIQHTSHLGAFRGNTLLAACLCYDHPGGTGLVFLPSMEQRETLGPVVCDLLAAQIAAAAHRGLTLVQAILEPGLTDTEALLQRAGFVFLADLLYLQRPVTTPSGPNHPTNLTWLPYGPQTHQLFLQTIEQTYRQSLDCPALLGRRRLPDILEGHKAASRYDTRRWSLALEHEHPAAVLLLARSPGQPNAEVVYMGVRPEARGRKLGRAVLHRANRDAHQANAHLVTLAVDAANTPAVRMYQAFGFALKSERRAWVRFP